MPKQHAEPFRITAVLYISYRFELDNPKFAQLVQFKAAKFYEIRSHERFFKNLKIR